MFVLKEAAFSEVQQRMGAFGSVCLCPRALP